MAYTQLGIVNLALRRLGVQKITALDDADQPGSVEANDAWEYIRDEVLEEHDWRFAKVRTSLSRVPPRVDLDCNDGKRLYVKADKYLADTLDISIEIYTNSSDALSVVEDPDDDQNIIIKLADTTAASNTAALIQVDLRALATVNGISVAAWTVTANAEYTAAEPTNGVDLEPIDMKAEPQSKYTYAYLLPSDFLRLAENKEDDPAVYPVGGYPATAYRWRTEWLSNLQATSTGYIVESLADGTKCLMTDYNASEGAPLYIAYIQRVTDVTRWSAMFIGAFGFRMGAELSFILPEDPTKFKAMMGLYADWLIKAEGLDQSLDFLQDETGSTDHEYAGR